MVFSTLNKILWLVFDLTLSIQAAPSSLDTVFFQITPFNTDSTAEILSIHYSFDTLLPYLQSKNPLVLQALQLALGQFPEFPGKLASAINGESWQIQGIIKTTHLFCLHHPEKIFSLPSSLFYPLVLDLSEPKTLILLADLFQFFPGDSSRHYLKILADHSNPLVRRYAVRSLCVLANYHDLPFLQLWLESDDFYLRYTARMGLKNFTSIPKGE